MFKAIPQIAMRFSIVSLETFFIKFKCRNEHAQTGRNTMKRKRY